MAIQVVILAAGMGTRLGKPWPKPLTELNDGRSIMQQQVDNIKSVFGDEARIHIVVGFKMEMIMEAQPTALFVYNEISIKQIPLNLYCVRCVQHKNQVCSG